MNEQKLDPVDFKIMNVDAFIRDKGLLEVTSSSIHATSSEALHPDGLFSERIFGEIGKSNRLINFGWIALNNRFVSPRLYESLLKLNSLYGKISNGSVYAIWDDKVKDFIVSNDEEGDTGMTFLLKHIGEVQPPKNKSISRNRMIDNLNRYRDVLFIDKMLVLPAGLRDITKKNGRDAYNDINDLYMQIIHLAKALKGANQNNSMFDQLRRAMQIKLVEVEQMLLNMVSGKGGFAQSAYGSRGIALGTRNVISATDITADSVDDQSMLRSDEVLVPLFQMVNMFKPLISYQIRRKFTEFVFDRDSDSATLIDPKTKELVHVSVTPQVKSIFLTADGINNLIKLFRDNHNKFNEVMVKTTDGKEYGLWMLYQEDDKIWYSRSKKELKRQLEDSGFTFKDENLRMMTYMEMFYIVSYAILPKYAMVTRFPVTHSDSTLMSKIHIATTTSYHKVHLQTPTDSSVEYDRWPIIGSDIVGAMSLHAQHLELYNGDHDGDTVSCIGVMSDDGTEECAAYNDSPRSIVSPSGEPTIGISTTMGNNMLTSLTMEI